MGELDLAMMDFLEAAKTAKGMKRAEPLARRLELALRKAFLEKGARFLRKFRIEMRSKFASATRVAEMGDSGSTPLRPTEGFEAHAAFLSIPLKEVLGPLEWLVIWYEVSQNSVKLFSDPINQAVEKALQIGAVNSLGEIGMKLSFSLENPRAAAYLENYGAKLVSGINEETRDQLQTILNEGIQNGWSYDKTAEAITDKFAQFAVGEPQAHIDSRAHMIAVTEIGNAYEEGNLEVAQDMQAAGLEMEKYWSTVGDDKVSKTICAPNEEAGWIPLNDPFPSGHMRPLGHPACRCDLKTRRKGS